MVVVVDQILIAHKRGKSIKGDQKMSATVIVGRNFLFRAKHDSDIITLLTEFADTNQITTAFFTMIGALETACIGFYSQSNHEYTEKDLSSPQEIASCTGNISLKEGKPFVHAHAVLTDENGVSSGGHLLRGKVFAAEIYLTELKGPEFIRKMDRTTGLYLWES